MIISLPVPTLKDSNNANRHNVNARKHAARAIAGYGAGLIARCLNAKLSSRFPDGKIEFPEITSQASGWSCLKIVQDGPGKGL
jgi:hypothetical protein